MKALGAVLVILSGLCLGLRGAKKLREREEALLDLRRTIQAFRAGVSYSALPLTELINTNRESRFCALAAEDQNFLYDPKAALERAGDRLLKAPGDLELYRSFVRGLGETGAEEQLEHLALCGSLVEASLSSAREEKEKRSRLYVCLGLFGGVALCLVLV